MNNSFQPMNGNGFGSSSFGASPDGLGAPAFGADQIVESAPNPAVRTLKFVWAFASIAGTAVGAYHGYKRNDSVGWAIVWAFLGGLAPIIVIPVAVAQGFPKDD